MNNENAKNDKNKFLFDMIVKDSALKSAQNQQPMPSNPTEETKKNNKNFIYILAFLLKIFMFPFFICIAINVISSKFNIPTFSYFDIIKIYLGVLCIKNILKMD